MTGFSAEWLRLREPFDHAAREKAAGALAEQVARWRERSPGKALSAIDLACGHGANLRALAPRLGGVQRWRLVDHDPALLAAVSQTLAEWAHRHDYRFAIGEGVGDAQPIDITGPAFHAHVVRHRVDLAHDLATLNFGDSPLVTASALLDLVSASWLQTLIRRTRAVRGAMLFGLNVDGRMTWHPADPSDQHMHRLFSQHQRRDKGFGPALGPYAAPFALQQMASAGYDTLQTQADWVIDGAQAPEMQLAMIEDMAAAALEQEPTAQAAVLAWKARRVAGVSLPLACGARGHRLHARLDRRAQIQIPQMIPPHSIHTAARAKAVGQARRACEPQARPTVTNDDWRHSQVQPIQTSLRKKARHRHAAPFHEQPCQAPRPQRRHGVRQMQRGVVSQQAIHGQHTICAGLRDGLVRPPCITQPQCGRLPVIEHVSGAEIPCESELWIEQHAGRAGTNHTASRQSGVVDRDRARSHDHGVAHGTQAMQMQQVLGAIDEA